MNRNIIISTFEEMEDITYQRPINETILELKNFTLDMLDERKELIEALKKEHDLHLRYRREYKYGPHNLSNDCSICQLINKVEGKQYDIKRTI